MTDLMTPAAPEVSRQRADTLLDWLREYASVRINSRLIDERRSIPPHIILDFGNSGLLGMQVPEVFGGLGLRHVDHLRLFEQLGAIDQTLAAVVFTHGVNGTRPIQFHARPALRDLLLPRLASGRELAAFALSEPAAGSNVGGIASQAQSDGQGGWRLRGLKRWNSSSWAAVISVFVRDVDERGRPGGLTGFVVRQGSPGLRIGPEALTVGLRGSVQNSLLLDDVPVGPEHLLGERGRGMDIAEDALSVGRLCIATVCAGALKRCAQLMARYCGRRTVASGRLLDNPVVLAALGELTARVVALDALVDQVARRLDVGQSVPPEIPMAAKIIGAEGLNWAAGQLMQFLGGRGYMENNLAPQILRDARLWSIGEGASEPLTIQVGRKTRLTDAIAGYLRSDPAGVELAQLLSESASEIGERCLNLSGGFADRSSAQLWADTLIGQVASDAILLAAAREAHRQSPSEHLARSVDWAAIRLGRRLRRARAGSPEERLMARASEIDATLALFAASIGDVEQTLAGEEDELDQYLKKSPGADRIPQAHDLPGHAILDDAATTTAPAPDTALAAPSSRERGRDRTNQALGERLVAARAGMRSSKPPRKLP
jgi:alkylation response protein AidB-like acyl-CoA dehydrogenase